MGRHRKKRAKKAGLAPGTLVHVGEQRVEDVKVHAIAYDEEHLHEQDIRKAEESVALRDGHKVVWIDVDGLHRIDLIERFGLQFGLHPLLMEDIVNTEQRPKLESYKKHLFFVFKMVYFGDNGGGPLEVEQCSIVLGPDHVLSFQEKEGDVFDPVRQRLRMGKGKIRALGPDFLAYALLDALVDDYFIILERFDDRIEELEEELLVNPTYATLQRIYKLRRDLITLRRAVRPMSEVIASIQRIETTLFKESTLIYLRDLYDHMIRVIDSVESFRDTMNSMLDTYLSSNSYRLNEVMKVLTIFAAIFIPLTFIVGVYGMNFHYMPELQWRWGYYALWGVMITLTGLMIFFFKRKRWF